MKPVLAAFICLWLAAASPAAGAAKSPAAGDFDPRVTRMERSESLYLEHLFELLAKRQKIRVASRPDRAYVRRLAAELKTVAEVNAVVLERRFPESRQSDL